jgi:hypothetical protein
MDRIFERILRTDGWAWLGLRAAALWCSERGREVATPPLPVTATGRDAVKVLNTAFVTT